MNRCYGDLLGLFLFMNNIKFRAWYFDKIQCGFHVTDEGCVCDCYYGGFRDSGSCDYYEDAVLMQYAGIKDKNGKEIYDGDILSEKWLVEVFRDKNTGAFMVKFHNNPHKNKTQTLYKYLIDRKVAGTEDRDNGIIGNIYENPELLKEVNNG